MISGIGIDILQLSRIRGVVNRRGAKLLAKRICTVEEYELFNALPLRSKVQVDGDGHGHGHDQARVISTEIEMDLLERQIRFLSSRWSLKEAAYKALSSSSYAMKISWKSLHVHHTSTGQPLVRLLPSSPSSAIFTDPFASSSAPLIQGSPTPTPTPTLMASLSHDAGVVVAVVIALRPFSQPVPADVHMQIPNK